MGLRIEGGPPSLPQETESPEVDSATGVESVQQTETTSPASSEPDDVSTETLSHNNPSGQLAELSFSGMARVAQLQAGSIQMLPKFASKIQDNANFKQLDESTKKQVLAQMKQYSNDAQAKDNLRQLATDPNFTKLSKETQKLVLANFANNPHSASNLNSIKEDVKNRALLEGDDRFKNLDDSIKKQVLDMREQFPVELESDNVKNINVDQARDNLRQLVIDPNFGKLSPEAQKLALNNLATRPDAAANLKAIKDGVKDGVTLEANPAFKRLDTDIRKQVLDLIGQSGIDQDTRKQLLKLVTTPDLKDLSAARAFATALPYQKLKELWNTPGGEKLLQSIAKQFSSIGPAGQMPASRIESARRAAQLEKSEDFGKLSEGTKAAVRNALEKSQYNPDITGNITVAVYTGLGSFSDTASKNVLDALVAKGDTATSKAVVKLFLDASFASLGDATQKMMLDAMVNKGADPAFAKALSDLSYNFTNLGEAERAKVVSNLSKFTETGSYKAMSDADKAEALPLISTMALYSAAHPTNTTAGNTLNHLVDGTVKVAIDHQEATPIKGTDRVNVTSGHAYKGVMYFNASNPEIKLIDEELVETAAHEVNHILNGDTKPGTAERFFDEYRAWYVGLSAVGKTPPSAAEVLERLRMIATREPDGSGYDHLRNLYRGNSELRGVVDQLLKGLRENPPKIPTPEDVRLKMENFPRTDYSGTGPGAAYDKSVYLNTSGNSDNR